MLMERVQTDPHNVAFRFFRGPALAHENVGYDSLWQQSAALAYRMQSVGLTGQRVLLICKSQKNFVVGLFACLLAGAVAVPTAPPRRKTLLQRLQLIVEDADPAGVIYDCDEIAQVRLHGGHNALHGFDLRSDGLDATELSERYSPVSCDDMDIAFLQYTSGSVGDPKGVVIRHRNIKHNCAAIKGGMAISADSSFCGALPLFHDMGLVGGVFLPFYCGCSMNYLSPIEFVQSPERWLQIVSAFKCSVSGGPNFMYELAARTIRPQTVETLDLSSWNVAFCGAEPVRPLTLKRFCAVFESVGFRPHALYPCYGLAEATLFVSGGDVHSNPTVTFFGEKEVASCGWPRLGTTVKIVDPKDSTPVAEGECGEIWVAGEGVSTGYWNRSELTAAVFSQPLAGNDPNRYLRTGDIGFVRHGELFVVGRIKDLIIINGINYTPHDLEREVQLSHAAVDNTGSAAFSIDGEMTDALIVVTELRREWLRRDTEWPAVITAIRAAIQRAYGLAVLEVVLIRPGGLPRTSSGKVRRWQCRVEYLAKTLPVANRAVIGRLARSASATIP